MDFSEALRLMMKGKRMTRSDGEYIYVTAGKAFGIDNWVGDDILTHTEMETGFVQTSSHIDRKKKDGSREIGWTPTTDDLFAKDWKVVE